MALVRAVFNKYDLDKSGTIQASEFKNLAYSMGHFLSDIELDLALKQIDLDGDGIINFEEFQKWWRTSDRFEKFKLDDAQLERLTKVSEFFRQFDKDHSGFLDAKEFALFYQELVKASLTNIIDVKAALKELDINHDQQVTFNEFVDYLIRHQGVADV